MWKWLQGKKTHISTIGVVATALAALLAGEISPLEFLMVAFGGGAVSSLRGAVAKK